MLSLKEAKMVFKQLGLSDEETEEFERISTPSIDFHKYLMEELDISSEEAQELTENKSKEYIVGKVLESTSQEERFSLAADAIAELAEENNYPKEDVEKLKTSILETAPWVLNTMGKYMDLNTKK